MFERYYSIRVFESEFNNSELIFHEMYYKFVLPVNKLFNCSLSCIGSAQAPHFMDFSIQEESGMRICYIDYLPLLSSNKNETAW